MDMKRGKEHGKPTNLLLNPENGQIHLVVSHEHPGAITLVNGNNIVGAGTNYLLIEEEEVLKTLYANSEVVEILRDSYVLMSMEVVSSAGIRLGVIQDVVLDERYELTGILLEEGREIGREEILSVCHGMVFVRSGGDKNLQIHVKEPEIEIEEVQSEISKSPSREDAASMPVGLTLKKDLVSEDGEFNLKAGTKITEAIISEAANHDVLVQLAIYAE